MGYWEYASSYDIRQAILAGTTYTDANLRGYDDLPLVGANVIATLAAWVRDGMMATNPLLRTAASDGTTIGAVQYTPSNNSGMFFLFANQ